LAIAAAPAAVFACGGCMPLTVREALVTEMTAFDYILSGEVIALETFKRPEYEAKAKEASEHTHGYGGDVETPDFDTKLTVKLNKAYKGKLQGETLTIWVKPTFTSDYCNYFHFKKNGKYIFFLDDKLEMSYYSLIYHSDPKDYSKEEAGGIKKNELAKLHKHIVKTLDIIASADAKTPLQFFDFQNNKYAEGAIANGNAEGSWTFFHYAQKGQAQKKSESGTYKNSLRVGEWSSYDFNNGTVIQRTVYENTEKDGKVSTYYNGFLSTEMNYKNGNFHGKQVYYHWNTTVISIIMHYAEGVLDGEYIGYDTDGKETSRIVYKNGEEQKA
jgi:antitoxin component YwqK of YwqJK toxin-antitoxin module